MLQAFRRLQSQDGLQGQALGLACSKPKRYLGSPSLIPREKNGTYEKPHRAVRLLDLRDRIHPREDLQRPRNQARKHEPRTITEPDVIRDVDRLEMLRVSLNSII